MWLIGFVSGCWLAGSLYGCVAGWLARYVAAYVARWLCSSWLWLACPPATWLADGWLRCWLPTWLAVKLLAGSVAVALWLCGWLACYVAGSLAIVILWLCGLIDVVGQACGWLRRLLAIWLQMFGCLGCLCGCLYG